MVVEFDIDSFALMFLIILDNYGCGVSKCFTRGFLKMFRTFGSPVSNCFTLVMEFLYHVLGIWLSDIKMIRSRSLSVSQNVTVGLSSSYFHIV